MIRRFFLFFNDSEIIKVHPNQYSLDASKRYKQNKHVEEGHLMFFA